MTAAAPRVAQDPFGRRLASAISKYGPLCAGIDPSCSLVRQWGLDDTPAGLASFGRAVLDAVEGVLAIVKPQSAFFERMGSAGFAVLEDLCRDARSRGLLVLLDAKRGDVGSTTQAYAQAYLDADSPFAVDAMTSSAYLGVAALQPLFDAAHAAGRGVFVVARSSNPEGAALQQAHVDSGADSGLDVVGHVLAEVGRVNAAAREAGLPAGEPGLGSVGVVFGATCETAGYDLTAMGGPILAPGLGAQGATVADIARRFSGVGGRVLPTVSRSLIGLGPDVAAMRAAAVELVRSCGEALR